MPVKVRDNIHPTILGLMADCHDAGDHWGSVMDAQWALADLYSYETGDELPGVTRQMGRCTREELEENFLAWELWQYFDTCDRSQQVFNLDDVRHAYAVIGKVAEIAERKGLSY
jgi:hypothetical protein